MFMQDGTCFNCPVDFYCPGDNQKYACPGHSTAPGSSSTMDSKNREQLKPRATKKEKKRKKHGCCPRLTAVQRPKKNRLVV
jgi:hypothetical protein